VTYPDGSVAPVGTVIQVNISGGVIPEGVTVLWCTIRGRFTDSNGQQQEATVMLNLTDTIPQ
jgi:hypothetical protein